MSSSDTVQIRPEQRDLFQGGCPTHPSNPVTSYCGNHRISMCIMCLLSNHKDCIAHVKPINPDINVDIEIDTATSRTSANEMERICERLATNVNDVKNRKTAWIENLGRVEQELIQGLRHIRFKIVQKIDILTTEATEMSTSLLKEHKLMYEHDVETLSDFQCRLRELKRRLSHLKDTDDLVSIQRQLEQIKNEFESRSMQAGDVKVHFHVSELVGTIDSDMAKLGELCVEDVTERVRSLYLSPSEIQRLSSDMLGELSTRETTSSTNRKSHLFIRKVDTGTKSEYLRLTPSPDVSSKIPLKLKEHPPPLPTMETRMLSFPNLIHKQATSSRRPSFDRSSSKVDSKRILKGNTLSTTSDMRDNIEDTSILAEVTEHFAEDNLNGYNDQKIRKGSMSSIGATFFEPNGDANSNIKEEANQDMSSIEWKSDEHFLKIPSLPKKRDASKQNPLLRFQSNDSSSESNHPIPTHKQQFDGQVPVASTNTTEVARISNSQLSFDGYYSAESGRDSGIVVNQETKYDIENSMLRRPLTPPPCGVQTASPLPCLPGRDETIKSGYIMIPDSDERDSASSSDQSIQARVNTQYSATKETNLEKATIRGAVRSIGPDQRRRATEKKRLVKSTGAPPSTQDKLGIYTSTILERGSERKSNQNKTRHVPFITSMAVLDGGDIHICDNNNNTIELYDSNGSLKDVICLQKPFGCCRIADNRLAATFQDPPKFCTFAVENSVIEQVDEHIIPNTRDVFGISFSYGFYCLSCLTEVKLIREQATEQEIQIRPLDRRDKSRSSLFHKGKPQKPFFAGVHFALMEKLDDRFYVFTSDAKKRRVASVGVNNMVIWIQTKLDAKTLAYYSDHVFVAADSHVTLLHASSGDRIRVIGRGIPRQCWSLAVDKEGCPECPSLLVAGCDKTSARHITRVPLEQAIGNRLAEVYV